MGRKYQLEHPQDPYDLSDVKGIASELAEEAADDAKELAGDIVEKVGGTATGLAEDAVDEARAASRYPRSYAGYSLRKLKRRAQLKPLDTLATAAAIAFLAGALWNLVRKARF